MKINKICKYMSKKKLVVAAGFIVIVVMVIAATNTLEQKGSSTSSVSSASDQVEEETKPETIKLENPTDAPSDQKEERRILHYNEVLDITFYYPEQYEEAPLSYNALISPLISGSCAGAGLLSEGLHCSFHADKLEGRFPIRVYIGSVSEVPSGTLRVSVGSGEVRAYMPLFGIYQYKVATPGNDAEVGGQLDKHPQSAGDLGAYAIWIESIGGPAEDIQVEFVPLGQ
jgi:hypothetical protein